MIIHRVGIDESQFKYAQEILKKIPLGAERARYRALNKAVKRACTRTVQSICRTYNIRPSDVRKKLVVSTANRYHHDARLVLRGSPLELMKFAIKPKMPPNQRGKKPEARTKTVAGVKFTSRWVLPHAFVARMKNGHIGIYSRREASKALRQRYTTSLPQMMNSTLVLPEVVEEAQRVLMAEFERQIALLAKEKPKNDPAVSA